MKKLLQTMKAFLVIAMLCAGTNVWGAEGDNIYSNDFSEKDQTDFATWTAAGKKPSGYTYAQIGRAGTFSIETGALVNTSLSGKANNNIYTANVGIFKDDIRTTTASTNYVLSFDITLSILAHGNASSIFEISDESKQVLICLYATHTRTNQNSGSTSYGYIVGGNNGFQVKEASVTSSTNAEGTFGDGTKHEMANITETSGSKTYHVEFNAQVAGKATLTIKEGTITIVDAVEYDIAAQKGLKYMYFTNHNYNDGGTQNTSSTLDNFAIVEGAASTNTADYMVKYVATISDVETEIKESVTRNGFKGATIELEASDKNNITYNDVKYIYSSDNASTTTIADDGSSVVKVQFVQAPTYTYTVTDNFGTEIANGSAQEGDDIYYYLPAYKFTDGRFYQNPTPDVGSYALGQGKITAIAANTNVTITYSEEENTNVVFYSEAENLTGITSHSDNYTKGRMSNGAVGYYGSSTVFETLAPGKYTLTSSTRSGTTTFYAGTVGSGTEIGSISSSGTVATVTSEEFTLYENTGIYTSTGSTNKYFDYVIIRKTGNATIPAAITSAGYTTFCSQYALDFSNVEGITAYIVTDSDDSNIKMTKIEKVPAETGLVLKGAQGNYNIPVATDYTDSDWPSGKTNYMVKCLEETTVNQSDNGTNYVLVVQDGKVVFAPVHNTSATVDANHAYLYIPNSNADPNAKSHSLSFAEENLTGIKTVSSNFTVIPAKRIENGQLVIEKNGKFYNAAGQLK